MLSLLKLYLFSCNFGPCLHFCPSFPCPSFWVNPSWPVWLITSELVTRWNHGIHRIRRWHCMWNASSFRSSAFRVVHVSHPYRRTENTCELYTFNLAARLSLDCFHTVDNLPMTLEAMPIRRYIVHQSQYYCRVPRYTNCSSAFSIPALSVAQCIKVVSVDADPPAAFHR